MFILVSINLSVHSGGGGRKGTYSSILHFLYVQLLGKYYDITDVTSKSVSSRLAKIHVKWLRFKALEACSSTSHFLLENSVLSQVNDVPPQKKCSRKIWYKEQKHHFPSLTLVT